MIADPCDLAYVFWGLIDVKSPVMILGGVKSLKFLLQLNYGFIRSYENGQKKGVINMRKDLEGMKVYLSLRPAIRTKEFTDWVSLADTGN